ncbi:hypothetical protein GCM10022377_00470 [Zhihengliuella alba]|uniref:CobQ/CobB/MinD/ParA nucleotide binding domain-containing protein n=1 Tax=Zhihengliuella alba TaxID=547018 RepID=A0ABP7CPB7_9MICC
MADKEREEHPGDDAREQAADSADATADATADQAASADAPDQAGSSQSDADPSDPAAGAAGSVSAADPAVSDAAETNTAEPEVAVSGAAESDAAEPEAAEPGESQAASNQADDEFVAAMEFHPADEVESAATSQQAVGASGTRFPAAESGARPGAASTIAAGGAEAESATREESAPRKAEQASDLTASRLLELPQRAPVAGWRRWLYKATFGRVNVGDSDSVRLARLTEHKIKAPLEGGTRFVTVLSRKGGVGKTTVTTLLGMALASVREDRVIALDANPDRGTLSDRSPGGTRFTARHLVQNRFMIDSFSKFAQYAAREGSRLHVLASDTDPNVAQAFDDADYRAVTDLASKFYSIVLTDSGTGMVHSVMKGSLEKSDVVVLVSGGSVDEARLASETLSWLEAHGRTDLAEKAIVVINQSAGLGRGVNIDEIEAHFASRVEHVVRLPFDPHLAEGSQVDIERLKPATREAAMELAALVVDQLRG